jgi:hypothetical protein
MLDFFKTHILYDKDGYNGFVSILFTAILMTFFEVVFFMNVGLHDIQNGLDAIKNKLKINLDQKLLGSKKYCNYLYNTTRTKHSDEIFNKYCKKHNNKKNTKNMDVDINEFILKLKQSSQIDNTLGGAASILYGTDIKSQVENIESIIKSVTNISDPEILISSLYDYYRMHPEFAQSNNVIKNLLKDKYNNEINNNAWELVIFIITILSTIIFMFKMSNPLHSNLSFKRILWNFAFVTFGIIAFQIYFYYNVATQYQFEGTNYVELIDFYKSTVK